MKTFIKKYLSRDLVIPMLILILSNLIIYGGTKYINELLGRPYIDMTGALDLAIPVVPEFTFVYILAYPFWYLSYYFLILKNRDMTRNIVITNVSAKLLCGLLFILVPTTNIRPELTGNTAAEWILNIIYSLDTPHNLFPSVHCFESWLCFTYIRDAKCCNRCLKIAVFVLTASICFSTVFTRQHVLIDVLVGVLIAEIARKLLSIVAP